MRYLVTGGAGFIGSHLAEELLRRGEQVRIVDNLSTGNRRNLEPLDGAEFIQGDIVDLSVARRAASGIDYILHQAAIPSVPRSIEDPIESHRANVDATLNVLVAARETGVRRVVFAGSSSVYGDSEVLPKREDMPLRPVSPYALQKLTGEQYLAMFTALYGLETVTTRYFNVFGPRQDPSSQYSGVISLFIAGLLDDRRITIHGNGEQTRDFTYVANVVDGVLKACTADVSGLVINLATGSRISINTLFATLRRLVGGGLDPEYGPSRAGDVRDSQADITLARTRLGYEPSIDFEQGLRRTLAWFQDERLRRA